jgi:hypothetical protein
VLEVMTGVESPEGTPDGERRRQVQVVTKEEQAEQAEQVEHKEVNDQTTPQHCVHEKREASAEAYRQAGEHALRQSLTVLLLSVVLVACGLCVSSFTSLAQRHCAVVAPFSVSASSTIGPQRAGLLSAGQRYADEWTHRAMCGYVDALSVLTTMCWTTEDETEAALQEEENKSAEAERWVSELHRRERCRAAGISLASLLSACDHTENESRNHTTGSVCIAPSVTKVCSRAYSVVDQCATLDSAEARVLMRHAHFLCAYARRERSSQDAEHATLLARSDDVDLQAVGVCVNARGVRVVVY